MLLCFSVIMVIINSFLYFSTLKLIKRYKSYKLLCLWGRWTDWLDLHLFQWEKLIWFPSGAKEWVKLAPRGTNVYIYLKLALFKNLLLISLHIYREFKEFMRASLFLAHIFPITSWRKWVTHFFDRYIRAVFSDGCDLSNTEFVLMLVSLIPV